MNKIIQSPMCYLRAFVALFPVLAVTSSFGEEIQIRRVIGSRYVYGGEAGVGPFLPWGRHTTVVTENILPKVDSTRYELISYRVKWSVACLALAYDYSFPAEGEYFIGSGASVSLSGLGGAVTANKSASKSTPGSVSVSVVASGEVDIESLGGLSAFVYDSTRDISSTIGFGTSISASAEGGGGDFYVIRAPVVEILITIRPLVVEADPSVDFVQEPHAIRLSYTSNATQSEEAFPPDTLKEALSEQGFDVSATGSIVLGATVDEFRIPTKPGFTYRIYKSYDLVDKQPQRLILGDGTEYRFPFSDLREGKPKVFFWAEIE